MAITITITITIPTARTFTYIYHLRKMPLVSPRARLPLEGRETNTSFKTGEDMSELTVMLVRSVGNERLVSHEVPVYDAHITYLLYLSCLREKQGELLPENVSHCSHVTLRKTAETAETTEPDSREGISCTFCRSF
jgi:hypothetical protein